MSDMDREINGLANTLTAYVNTRVDIVKLKAAEKTSLVVSNLLAGAVVACVFFFFLMFAGIACALALSDWLGKLWSGFLIVAGFYLLAGWIAWHFKESLIRIPLMNNIIHQLFKEDMVDE